jgi:CubicO group peptidase (beta-lactamase class C family)
MYSNTGYTLLGTIVLRVSGKSLREFASERIFTPLGMTSTQFYDDHTMIVPGGTAGYNLRQGAGGLDGGRGAPPSAPSVDNFRISFPVNDYAGGTSLSTTVEDMTRWERNFLQPTVGDARMIEQMNQRGWLNSGDSIPHAFALTHGEFGGARTISYNGSDGGYRADYLRFPDQRSAFITLCNIGSANPTQLNRRLAAVVLADQLGPVPAAVTAPATPPEVPLPPASLRALAGVYVDTTREKPLFSI